MLYCDEILSSFKTNGMYSVFSVIRSQDVIIIYYQHAKEKEAKAAERGTWEQKPEYQLFFFSSSYF